MTDVERPRSPDDEVVDGQIVEAKQQRSPRLDVGLDHTRYVSPLPRPDDYERYEALVPGSAERLLAASEREQIHRHQLENRLATIDEGAMPKYYQGQKHGHLVALGLGIGYEVVMAIAVLKGYALEGVVGAGAGIAAMVAAARRETSSRKDDARAGSE